MATSEPVTEQEQAGPALEADQAPVTWRDGVHIRGTAIWCDARRVRDVCFVSCADAVPAARHGQLVATAETLKLLARRGPRVQPQSQLSVPYGHPFNLGTRRIELFRSGHAVGAASMAVDVDGRRVVYAGAVNPGGGGLGGEADMRACDTLVMAAAYGAPGFAFPPVDEVAADVAAFCRRVAGRGGAAVLLVGAPLKGLDVAARLAGDRMRVIAHRAIHHAARRLAPGGLELPRVRRFRGRVRPGEVLLWLAGARDDLARAELPEQSGLALVSGAALDPDRVAASRVEAAFPWSNQADYRRLLEYLEASSAARVYLTDRFAESLAAELSRPGRPVQALGPPRQMSLF